MKRTLVAILALSPVLAFAQTNAPAQPRSTPVLQSKAVAPASLLAATSSADRAATASTLRVSTGVTPPHVIHTVDFVTAGARTERLVAAPQTVVVDLNVDETGKPTSLSIAKSAGAVLDHDVIATVSQYRFQPATLDGQPTAISVKLQVIIPTGTSY